jgi:hypothetical protein
MSTRARRAGVGAAAAAAALISAGCGSAGPVASSRPAASASAASASAAASSRPAAAGSTTAAANANVRACRAMEHYPAPHGTAQVDRYLSFLSRQLVVAADPRLKSEIGNVSAGILGVMAGTESKAKVIAAADAIQSICTSYGAGS